MPLKGRERFVTYVRRAVDKGAKQYEIAADLRITESYLSQVLSGRRRPGLDIAVRIEDYTGIPVSSWAERRYSRTARPQPKGPVNTSLATR